MLKKIYLIAILVVFIPATALSQVTYDARNSRLSVSSEGSTLRELLLDVSQKADIDVYMNPDLNKKIFVDFKDQPLETAIKRIIRPLNHAFVYQGDSIRIIKIFERSESEATAKVLPGNQALKSSSQPSSSTGAGSNGPTLAELKARGLEMRRQNAISQGKLEKFDEKEADREKRRLEREKRRAERRAERKLMREKRRNTVKERKEIRERVASGEEGVEEQVPEVLRNH
ncbi:MAG: hypothetical protein VST72_05225 [Nitrospirota bacterium]|nr:hypothetical protein [Nitrospirota bacterium]